MASLIRSLLILLTAAALYQSNPDRTVACHNHNRYLRYTYQWLLDRNRDHKYYLPTVTSRGGRLWLFAVAERCLSVPAPRFCSGTSCRLIHNTVNTSWWFGLMATQLCGYLLSDRIPLRIARHRSDWHPEYRLYNVFFVVVASPLGLGIFGAGLQ